MSPEEVTLDLARTDEFSLAWESLPPYGSVSAWNVQRLQQ
jgi:hypothetical protein